MLVDEYQDTNALQAEILLRAASPTGDGVTVVGDDAQAIYSFRAATVENILELPGALLAAGATWSTLEDNYRSTQPVLDAANALMAEGGAAVPQDAAWRARRAARGRATSPSHDDQAQADYVVERVLETREAGCRCRRQAVLFRSSHHSDVLELELVRRNIPYVKYGGLKFLEAAHVKDLLAVLRWADNPRNRIAAFRALQLLPGMGPAHAQRACDAFEASGYPLDGARRAIASPAAAREHWPAFAALMAGSAPRRRRGRGR